MSAIANGMTRENDARMKGYRPVRAGSLLVVGTVLLILGVLAGGILGHFSAPAAVATSATEHLYLSIAYDPYTGLDKYFPANFTVPANVPILITITNYDNGTNVVPADFAKVLGTVDGIETVTNATLNAQSVSSVAPDQITHTFTMDATPYPINIPIPAAQGTDPTVVSFTVVFTSTGQFVWHCMAPCDMDAMATPGFMMGTVTVVSA